MKRTTAFLACMLTLAILPALANDSARLSYILGLSERDSGRLLSASSHFLRAVELDSVYVDAHRELGLSLMGMRQYEKARGSFEAVLRHMPDDTLSIDRLTLIHFNHRRWRQALQYGRRLMSMGGGARLDYMLGKSHMELEEYDNAFRHLDAAYKEEPRNAEIPFLIARGLFDLGDFKLSSKYYGEAVALDTTKPQWVYEAAIAHASIPEYKTAIGYFETAMRRGYKVDDDFVENLSETYVAAGMPEKAIDMQRALLAKRPMDRSLMFIIGETYYRMRSYKEAIAQWEDLVRLDNDNARAVYMIGMAHQKKGEVRKGQALCNKAIEMDPSLRYYRQVVRW